MKLKTCAVMELGLVLAIMSANVSAAPAARQFYSNPTGYCQGALPVFETAIRKRPLAVQNESTSSAFVTCSFPSQGIAGAVDLGNPIKVVVYFNTVGGAQVTLSCTGVSGYQTGSNQFIVKSVAVPADGQQTAITWNGADFAGSPTRFPSGAFGISCELPPGVAINDSEVGFSEEIGN